MRGRPVSILVAFTTASLLAIANAQTCAAGSGTGIAQEINGNWYCSEVKAITYAGFPGRGRYNRVTNMDAETGQCSSEPQEYSGSLSPLNEELSLHVRGPVLLKQVAVYTLNATTISGTNRKRNPHKHGDAHAQYGQHDLPGHQWLHGKRNAVEPIIEPELESHHKKRAIGDMVTATIDGELASWTNEYAGPGVATLVAGAADSNDSSPKEKDAIHTTSSATPTSDAKLNINSASTTPSDPQGTTSGSWVRQAYYHAESGTVEGITFLNHFGGVDGIPGTAAGGSAFGASLSYASSDGKSGAASPQTLSDTLLEDGVEVVLMSNRTCSDGSCGYTRPGGVSYHGFSPTPQRLFLLSFAMPFTSRNSSTSQDITNTVFNADTPAIWLLNALIPLTSQYGTDPSCSCWTSGCGELDLFEVLDGGDWRCKSTLHMAPAGGSSDWIRRPSEGVITAVVGFVGEEEKVVIRVLDEGATTFGDVLSGSVVSEWLGGESSVFRLGS